LQAKIGSDEAKDEDFGHSKARTTAKYVPIFATTRRAGANFPDLGVTRHEQTPGLRRSSLLDLGKIGFRRRPCESE
jgi:plasmid stabilization system protein ParE